MTTDAGVAAASPRWELSRPIAWLLVLCAAMLPWVSLIDHPVWPPEEGRYGQIGARMAESGDWILPMLGDRVHLTKPPLSYWAIGVATECFGRGPAAVRVPSALATSLTVLLLMIFGTRFGSRAAGCAAALLFAVMPITMAAGRLGAPDAMMTFAWFGSLCAGICALEPTATRARRVAWSALFWGGAAVATMLKAPIGLAPVVIVYAGLALAGRWRDMLRLGPWWGIPLALAPLAAWAAAISRAHPELLSVLWNESVGRATGELGKRSPWWTYLPVFAGGLWPATAMLTLPIFNLSWRATWERVRADPFMVLAILGPLLVFSLSKGKLPHYLLPLAPPLALLCGRTVAAWAVGARTSLQERRAPDVRFTLFITVALGAAAAAAGVVMAPESLEIPGWWGWVLIPATLTAALLVSEWSVPQRRRRAMVVAWAGIAASWLFALAIENQIFRSMGAPKLIPLVAQAQGSGGRLLAVVDLDTTRPYYFGAAVVEFGERPADAQSAADAALAGDFVLLDPRVETEFFRGIALRGLALIPGTPRTVRLLWWRDAQIWRVESPEKSSEAGASSSAPAP